MASRLDAVLRQLAGVLGPANPSAGACISLQDSDEMMKVPAEK